MNFSFSLYNQTSISVEAHRTSSGGVENSFLNLFYVDYTLPVPGTYYVQNSIAFSGFSDSINNISNNYSDFNFTATSTSKTVRHDYKFWTNPAFPNQGNLYGYFYLPTFIISPLSSYNVTSTNTSDTYNIGTRASSITGNYGIVNSGSGTVEKIDSQTIVNETNNTYYSPATGQPETFNDWSYDYSDRSYTLTLESGDTTTVRNYSKITCETDKDMVN